jgi:hypothetical protein
VLAGFGVLNMASKICPWDGRFCSFVSCDFVEVTGNVRVCSRHKNKHGFHVSRNQVLPVASIFNKHVRISVRGFGFQLSKFLCCLERTLSLGVSVYLVAGVCFEIFTQGTGVQIE